MRERLRGGAAPDVVAYVTEPGVRRDAELVWTHALRAHRAHARALRAVPELPHGVADQLVQALEALEVDGPTSLSVITDDVEDLYHAVERTLVERHGADVVGWLQTGRSRNDHLACVARSWAREELTRVAQEANALRALLCELSRTHAATVMTGYTHQQPAQPITFGHYLLGVAHALGRDLGRLNDAWSRVNECPLGSGAMAGVSWPLDRDALAASLAFDAPTGNSLDGVASRDVVHEVAGAFALLAVTLSRVAADLQQFATWEFGLVEVDDAVAAVSSVMPQKKNPVTLEHGRGAAAQAIGAWVAMTTAAKGSPFGHHRESSVESMRGFAEATFQTRKAIALLRTTLAGLRVNEARMADAARHNFSTMTDLADALVRRGGLTFRAAHGVVGAIVRRLLERGEGPSAVTLDLVQEVTAEVAGTPVDLDEATLRVVTDPAKSIAARSLPGGPSAASLAAQVANVQASIAAADNTWRARRVALDSIDQWLKEPGVTASGGTPSEER